MSLTFGELESVTDDYFMLDGGKAIDIYFKSSFILDRWLNKHKAIWDRPNGGKRIRIPLAYDIAEGGSFGRTDTLTSDDREILNAAYYLWKHYYGNATLFETDELENNGEFAEVQLVNSRLEAAQKKITKDLSTDIHSSASDSAKPLTGFLSLFNTTTSTKYGDIAEADLVAADGTKPWKANLTTTTEGISLKVIRDLASSAKIGDGPGGKPNIGIMPETLLNIVLGILQAQQQFRDDTDTVKAGFLNCVFEGKTLAADDYTPPGYLELFNEEFVGFSVHAQGFYKKKPWAEVPGKAARTMKIMFHGNVVCKHRAAHAAHSNLN
jgi:hypothetical protein